MGRRKPPPPRLSPRRRARAGAIGRNAIAEGRPMADACLEMVAERIAYGFRGAGIEVWV